MVKDILFSEIDMRQRSSLPDVSYLSYTGPSKVEHVTAVLVKNFFVRIFSERQATWIEIKTFVVLRQPSPTKFGLGELQD